MKYEYHDLIIKTLLTNHKKIIDKHTLKNGKFVVSDVVNGTIILSEERKKQLSIKITYGKIEDILGYDGFELDIEFTIYEIFYYAGVAPDVLCSITVNT